jgi:cytochrome c oxidase subunit 1
MHYEGLAACAGITIIQTGKALKCSRELNVFITVVANCFCNTTIICSISSILFLKAEKLPHKILGSNTLEWTTPIRPGHVTGKEKSGGIPLAYDYGKDGKEFMHKLLL